MTVYIQKVKGQLNYDIIMFCMFLAIIQHQSSGIERGDWVSQTQDLYPGDLSLSPVYTKW